MQVMKTCKIQTKDSQGLLPVNPKGPKNRNFPLLKSRYDQKHDNKMETSTDTAADKVFESNNFFTFDSN